MTRLFCCSTRLLSAAAAVLTSGEQVGEVGLGAPKARVPLAVVARQHVLLARQPALLIQAVVLLQEP